jgi:hypothetical protein
MFSWLANIVRSPAKKISSEEIAPKEETVPPQWFEQWAKDLESHNPEERCDTCDNLHVHPEEVQNVYEVGICKYYGLPCTAKSHCFSKHYRKVEIALPANPAQTSLALLDVDTLSSGSEDIESKT